MELPSSSMVSFRISRVKRTRFTTKLVQKPLATKKCTKTMMGTDVINVIKFHLISSQPT